jgi:long-chain acyl-CoA synthetase
MSLRDALAHSARTYPNHPAIFFRETTLTYAELHVAVRRCAAALRDLGLQQGERIALLLPNCPPFILGYYAAAEIGAVAVPASPLLKPAELEYIWADAEVRMVITAGPLLAHVQAARQNLPRLSYVVSVTAREELPDPAAADNIPGFLTFPELLARGAQLLAQGASPSEGRPIEDNDCAVIIYTSGTTGRPKGAMLSHRNLRRNVEQVQEALRFTDSDRFLTALPLFHSFAGTICQHLVLARGCAAVLLENFLPNRVLEAVEKHKVTIFPAVPAMYHALLNSPLDRAYDTSSLRFFISGGAPLPAALLHAVEARFGVPVLEGDGPTECSPVTSVNLPDQERKVGSVGLPLPGVKIAVFDDKDNPLPANEIGEIVVQGDNVMLGYLNQPEATAEVMTSGWYHTGDLGKIDEDGYVYIVDRKKDMIITAGLNVYPREIEEALFTHPGVQDAAVIGQPNAARGEEVVAVIVKRPNVELTERELIHYCRERLANYKVPRRVLFRETLPRGGTGKVVKRLLKKELEMEGV